MAALEFLSQPLWQRLAWALLHFVWQGALIALVLTIALALLRSAHARYLAALAALLAMVMCPPATMLLVNVDGREAIATAVLADEIDFVDLRDFHSPLPTPHSPLEILAAAQPYFVLAWLSGVLALSVRLLVSYQGVRRLRATAQPLDRALLPGFHRLARLMRVSGNVRASASTAVQDALVVGLFRPLILIPASWITELPPQTLEAVLAHELAHIRRHDLWVNLLARVVETLLFYQPAVWYVSRVLRVEREKCCDELAVAATGERLAYVEALQLVAHRRVAASPSMWATAMGGAKAMNLLERVRNVLGLAPAASAARYWPVGAAALALPLGIWCATAAFAPARADDEEKKDERPAAKKEEPRREGDRPDARREEPRREGDRPRGEGVRREGDRPAPAREGDRPAARREGDRPAPREGDRPMVRREGDRPAPREGERRPEGGAENNPHIAQQRELMRAMAELREEVMRLRQEVNELRQGRGRVEGRPDAPQPREGERRPNPDRPRGEGDRPMPDRPRGEGDRPRGAGERPMPDRPRGEGDRPGERPRGEGDRPREGGERRVGVERREVEFTPEEREQIMRLRRAMAEAAGTDAAERVERELKTTLERIMARKAAARPDGPREERKIEIEVELERK